MALQNLFFVFLCSGFRTAQPALLPVAVCKKQNCVSDFELCIAIAPRNTVRKAMLQEFHKRYSYRRVFAIPARSTTSSRFRNNLLQLLCGNWDVSDAAAAAEQPETNPRLDHVKRIFDHLKGDLTQSTTYEHWCCGCCSSEDEARQKATWMAMGQWTWSVWVCEW